MCTYNKHTTISVWYDETLLEIKIGTKFRDKMTYI